MQPGNQPPREIGYVFIRLGCVILVFGWTLGLLSVISGRRIAARRSRVFSMVVAGINCISFPLGTALGVFTIIVLSKGTVKTMYDQPNWTSPRMVGAPRVLIQARLERFGADVA